MRTKTHISPTVWQNLFVYTAACPGFRTSRLIYLFSIGLVVLSAMLFGLMDPAQASQQATKFSRLMIEDGLSQSSVNTCMQDSRGFMWFTTEDGLNRFDGYAFQIYRNDPADPYSLSHNYTTCLLEDTSGDIWVGTNGLGLNRFNYTTCLFYHFLHDPDNASTLSDNTIQVVFQYDVDELWVGTRNGLNKLNTVTGEVVRYSLDAGASVNGTANSVKSIAAGPDGGLWLGTESGGLCLFDPEEGCVRRYPLPGNQDFSIQALFQDIHGILWVGCENGLFSFDQVRGQFEQCDFKAKGELDLCTMSITSFASDFHDNLWIGTNNGLMHWNRHENQFNLMRNSLVDPTSLSDNNIFALAMDRSHVLWVGSKTGLNMLNLEMKAFRGYHSDPNDVHTISQDVIRAFVEDKQGDFWIATLSGGLNRWDRTEDLFYRYSSDLSDPKRLNSDNLYSLAEDTEGYIWIGTDNGVYRLNTDTEVFTNYYDMPGVAEPLTDPTVRVIVQDRSGYLWFGTEGGLNRWNPDTGKLDKYYSDPLDPQKGLADNYIYALYEDQHGEMWVGTLNGLTRITEDRKTFRNYYATLNDPTSLSNIEALSICEDSDGVLWVGTGGGLNRFERESDTFSYYLEKDGLPNNTIYSILEDNAGFLWVSTNRGLSRFDRYGKVFRNYDRMDGLQSDEYNLGARLRTSTGEILFGSIRGFDAFYPGKIRDNLLVPKITFTDIKVLNRSVVVGEQSVLQEHISGAREIELSYRDYTFSFEFAALHYGISSKNRYQYKLEGVDTDWVDIGTRRMVSYTNLPADKYVFRVRGSNCDGVWNLEGTSIKLVITPPFWATTQFRVGVVFLVVGILLLWINQRTKAIRRRNLELELRVAERTEELERANQAKSEFLANMSHEIRTPMNCVIGMSDLLMDMEPMPEQRHYLDMIRHSSRGLLTLINDILDLSKIEAGQLLLEPVECDLLEMCEEVIGPLAFQANTKGLELVFHYDPLAPKVITGDSLRIKQVLINLLNNAIKFTDKGHILFLVSYFPANEHMGESFSFRVSDTGPGIAENNLQKLFEKFTQADASTTRKYGGTGLGLTISRQLVELMGGQIEAHSKIGEGATFSFALPLTCPGPDETAVALIPDLADIHAAVIGVNPALAMATSELSEAMGMRCETLPVDRACQALAQASAAGDPFAIVMVDERWVDGDLAEASARIRSACGENSPAMVLLRAPEDVLDMDEVLDAGYSCCLQKPVLPRTLQGAVQRALGVGSVVPICQDAAKLEAEKQKREHSVRNGLRILLAEDNPFNQTVATLMLKKIGCKVDVVDNGKLACERLDKVDYDIVLMDCQMPEMDGYEATRQIRAREDAKSKIPIIAMTAHAMAGDRERCLASGMNDYTAKPIDREKLARAIVRWQDTVKNTNAEVVPS